MTWRTDATGRMFVSYRRERADEVARLVDALHLRGVPTWQDVEDLGSYNTETEVRSVLADPTTVGAVVWITPDVADSAFVLGVEIPLIVERARRQDGFLAVLVAAGGLDYEAAGSLASRRVAISNLTRWNQERVNEDPVSTAEARRVAERVLRLRLAAIDARLAADEPVCLVLQTYRRPSFEVGRALAIDWSSRFVDGRLPAPDAWKRELEPALRSALDALALRCPTRDVRARGLLSLGAAMALGYHLRDPVATPLTWEQYHAGRWSDWSIGVPAETTAVTASREGDAPHASVLALLVSATQSVEPKFATVRSSILPPLRGIVSIDWSGRRPSSGMTPGQGVHLANVIRQELLRAREDWALSSGELHVFIAAPAALAVLIGQRLNSFGPVTVYEESPGASPYAAGVTFGTG